MVVVTFTSKQDERSGQWGQIRVAADSVRWTDRRVNAWDREVS